MKRFIVSLIALLALVASSFAGQPMFSVVVSADDTNTNTAITGLPNNRAGTVIVINDGPDEVYLNFTTGVATVAGAYLLSGESLKVTDSRSAYYLTNIGVVCDTGETATVRIFGFPTAGD